MRQKLLIFGLFALAMLWLGPLPQVSGSAFWAHMTLHMGVVAVAAPLLALGVAGGRADPVRKLPGIIAPIPASILEFVIVWTWHAPSLHHAARQSISWRILEQSSFLLAGLLLWLSAFGGSIPRSKNRSAAGVIGLLLTSMHMTLLGALLALSPRPLYTHLSESAGLTPLQDQHLGGAIMILVGGVSYLFGGLWLTAGLLSRAAKTQEKTIL